MRVRLKSHPPPAARVRRGSRTGPGLPPLVLLPLLLWMLWSGAAAGRPYAGAEPAEPPGDVGALARILEVRAAQVTASLARLDGRRLALEREREGLDRRVRRLDRRLEGLRRDLATLAQRSARLAAELAAGRERDQRMRLERERAARALLARLRHESGSGTPPPARLRLLLRGLLRADDGATPDLARLEERRRELARARASLSMTRSRLEDSRLALLGKRVMLDHRLARLVPRRTELVRRLDAARGARDGQRRIVRLARDLARFAPSAGGPSFATPVAARTGPFGIAPNRGLEAPAGFAPLALARLRPRSVPPAPPFPPPGAGVAGSPVLPVSGRIVSGFGDERAGIFARGITVEVDRDQPVRAVRGGRVVFAQPFRRFGLVLILDHGDGYHTLLAGMTRLDVRRGDRIAAGAVVGLMARAGRKGGRLYFELRQQGRPVNPLPWLAARADRTRG